VHKRDKTHKAQTACKKLKERTGEESLWIRKDLVQGMTWAKKEKKEKFRTRTYIEGGV